MTEYSSGASGLPSSILTDEDLGRIESMIYSKKQWTPRIMVEPKIQAPNSVKSVSGSGMTNSSSAGMIESSSETSSMPSA